MPQALTKAALTGIACLATVAAATMSPATSLAASHPAPHKAQHAAKKVTPFGYNATVYGTKVETGGAEIRTLKDALINRGCTRQVGLTKTVPSLLSTSLLPAPVSDFVTLSVSTSHTETYKKNGVYGIKGVSDLGDVSLGGATVAGVHVPTIKLQGLESVADAYFDSKANGGKGKFGQTHSFGYKGLKLELYQDDQISSTVQSLLDILGIKDSDAVNNVVAVPLNALIKVISTTPLEIPGLGTISLGKSSGSSNATSARATAYALKIVLENSDAGLDKTSLELGQAASVISRPVMAGVFRSRMSALEATIGGTLSIGGIGQRTLPCEGTGGKVVTNNVAHAGIPQVLDMSGIQYKYQGAQHGKHATGFVQTSVGDINLLQAGVEVKGLVSRVNLDSKKPNTRVKSSSSVKIAQLFIGGKQVAVPAIGKVLKFTDSSGQQGFLVRGVLSKDSNTYFGRKLTGLQVTLPGTNTTIDLGVANGQVFFN